MNRLYNSETLVDVIKTYAIDGHKGLMFINGNEDKFLSYQKLLEEALRVLYSLQSKGIKPRDEVLIQIENEEDYLTVFWACLLGNLIPVPVSVGRNDEHKLKLIKIWERLNNPCMVSDNNTLDKIRAYIDKNPYDGFDVIGKEMEKGIIHLGDIQDNKKLGKIQNVKPSDIAFIQYSSGSTGNPKGVMLTHHNLLSNIKGLINAIEMTEEDSSINWMPLTHDMGLIAVHLKCLCRGANQYIIPTMQFIRNPLIWLKKASEHKATILYSSNFGFKYLLIYLAKSKKSIDWDLSSIRLILNGAEPISTDVCDAFLDEMEKYQLKRSAMFTVYGLAEASVGVSMPEINHEYQSITLSRSKMNIGDHIIEVEKENTDGVTFVYVGKAIDYCQIRICDNDNNPLDDNRIGNIQIKGENVTLGYYNDPEQTKKIMVEDGWVNTGDLGFIHNEQLVITGRVKDLICVHGQNYYAHDLERVIEELEIGRGLSVACSVYNAEVGTEEVVVFILYRKKIENFIPLISKIKNHVKVKMGLEIDKVIPVGKINKTTSGKVKRYRLKQRLIDGEFTESITKIDTLLNQEKSYKAMTKYGSKTEQGLLECMHRLMNDDDIGIHDNIIEKGLSSIMIAKFMELIDEKFPNKLKVTDIFSYPTIEEIACCIDVQNDLELFPLTVEESYLLDEPSGFYMASIEMQIEGDMYDALKKYINIQNTKLDAVLLASYIYLISELIGQESISVQTKLDDNECIKIYDIHDYEFKSMVYFIDYIQEMLQDHKQGKKIPVNVYSSLIFSNIKKGFIPFIYNKAFGNIDLNLLKTLNMIVEIDEGKNCVFINTYYNNHYFKTEKIEEFMYNYYRIINWIIREFQDNK